MSGHFHTLAAEGITLALDLRVGHIRSLEIEQEGRRVAPLYTAPWVDELSLTEDESILPNLRFLSGDFFCAPFGSPDEEGVPSHGWPANSAWDIEETRPHPRGGSVARFALRKRVMGARLAKEITLRDGHPFVYQRHVFEGGAGAISVASHAMTKFAAHGRLSFSPKAYGETPARPLEPDPQRGRYALQYPARFSDLGRAPLRDGGTTDLCSYPFAERHEDFAMLVEAAENSLGWAAAIRDDAADLVLSLKNPADLPVTMLWFSNGGRDYKPWNGRNVGVLGIEEARAWSANGLAASRRPNALSESGVPTVLELSPDGSTEVRHVIGGLPRPSGWTEVNAINVEGETLRIYDVSGESVSARFDPKFLAS